MSFWSANTAAITACAIGCHVAWFVPTFKRRVYFFFGFPQRHPRGLSGSVIVLLSSVTRTPICADYIPCRQLYIKFVVFARLIYSFHCQLPCTVVCAEVSLVIVNNITPHLSILRFECLGICFCLKLLESTGCTSYLVLRFVLLILQALLCFVAFTTKWTISPPYKGAYRFDCACSLLPCGIVSGHLSNVTCYLAQG